ncbi:SDR family NAD(P)-dependent oxidoreductase [Sphingomonas sp. H39-1-10]|uniref:SDR family NAD(P)-dependent oxidoreductase n=1 Tax=Sphingomonas pollutisoli TaxID=3030829 RepID=UPI0023BA0EEE|nr:SDR family NAD(P)-dependent oxidoreductase [Sphingomonas pollutisoli]MDF0489563.1 SDR family NAD(P)-dependent oxidoreductase [Sphingomonas pollutisoli]
MADQETFAWLSGDRNPLHLDPLAARRTQAGVVVVHGVHAMLWALDCWLEAVPSASVAAIGARFDKFVEVGARIEARASTTRNGTRLEIYSGRSRLAVFNVRHQAPESSIREDESAFSSPNVIDIPAEPRPLDFDDAARAAGVMPVRHIAPHFAALRRTIGGAAVDGLAGLSTLVGMIAPGLHSILAGLDITFDERVMSAGGIAFQVERARPEVRLLDIAVRGRGLAGTVRTFVRSPPVTQPTMRDMRAMIGAEDFAGRTVLVIGGSRGLGELAAKALAAGGATVTISYLVGRAEAEAVRADIVASGGRCEVLRYDALQDPSLQLEGVIGDVEQLYYFATTKIFVRTEDAFDAEIFQRFCQVYVEGFSRICAYLSKRGRSVRVFYPSSVAVTDRPQAMTEYAMAKAAGEILCADIGRFVPHVDTMVRRLPRLLTDQTAGTPWIETPSGVDVILDVVREMSR